MKSTLLALLGSACLLGAFAADAQTLPAGAPAGTTVQCKDGSFASPDTKSGACRGHKGIQTWFGKADAASATKTAAAAPATPAPATPATPAAPATAAATAAKPAATATNKMPPNPATMTAAPGGGAGQVWANEDTKVYHCMGDRYYGKTKKGSYMSEADAKAKGMHASHNKACAA